MDGRCLHTNNLTLFRLVVRSYMLFSQQFISSVVCGRLLTLSMLLIGPNNVNNIFTYI